MISHVAHRQQKRSTTVANGILQSKRAVLLCKRSREKLLYPGCWGLPGGHLEPGETPEQALARELREELGVTPTSFERILIFNDDAPSTEVQVIYHIYLVTAWDGGPAMLGGEHSEIRWFDLETACELADLALLAYKPLFRSLLPSSSGIAGFPT